MAAFWTILAILVRMCRNGNKTISDVQFDPILSFPCHISYIVGLVYNYRNSLSEDFTGDAKNVL